MVLPEWIEHSTSPLPRGCSTTELRQRKKARPVQMSRRERGGNCHKAYPHARQRLAAGAPAAQLTRMAEQSSKSRERQRREERLAAALRENLRKRKAQARERERVSDHAKQEPEPGQD